MNCWAPLHSGRLLLMPACYQCSICTTRRDAQVRSIVPNVHAHRGFNAWHASQNLHTAQSAFNCCTYAVTAAQEVRTAMQ